MCMFVWVIIVVVCARAALCGVCAGVPDINKQSIGLQLTNPLILWCLRVLWCAVMCGVCVRLCVRPQRSGYNCLRFANPAEADWRLESGRLRLYLTNRDEIHCFCFWCRRADQDSVIYGS